MADLDEISMMLGEIKADVRHMVKWSEEHELKDQERFEKLTERMDINNGYRFRLEALEDICELHQPIIDSVTRAKWVIVGVIITVGAVGGVFGGWAMSMLKLLV